MCDYKALIEAPAGPASVVGTHTAVGFASSSPFGTRPRRRFGDRRGADSKSVGRERRAQQQLACPSTLAPRDS